MSSEILNIHERLRDPPVIETPRLILRKVTLDDAADMFQYASDPEVSRYTTWPPHQSIEDSRIYLRHVQTLYASGQAPNWGLVNKADQKFIGTCGIGSWIARHARIELGFALARPYWGQGLMPEAVRAVIAFAFDVMEVNRIESSCLAENIRSARVMEKLGMTLDGILRQCVFVKGHFHDLRVYSLLRQEWKEPTPRC